MTDLDALEKLAREAVPEDADLHAFMEAFDPPTVLKLIEVCRAADGSYAQGARDERERISDALSDALQSDLENGVKCINERAAEKFSAEYPELRKALAALADTGEPQ